VTYYSSFSCLLPVKSSAFFIQFFALSKFSKALPTPSHRTAFYIPPTELLCIMQALLLLSFLTGSHAGSRNIWPASAYAQANATLSQLTTAEKVSLASGNNLAYASCHFSRKECSYVGFIEGIPRLGLSPIYLEDGPQGVADGMTGVTQWPSIMTLSQAWRPELALQMGTAMGEEQKAKGSNVMLGPAVALVRTPLSGRNFEYISEDPFLNAAIAGPMVTGIQSNSISACVKHWIFKCVHVPKQGQLRIYAKARTISYHYFIILLPTSPFILLSPLSTSFQLPRERQNCHVIQCTRACGA
jgi:hypothetical protein